MSRDGDAPFASRRADVAVTLVGSLVLTACASAYGRFHPEAEIPACAAWLREADGIPCRTTRRVAGTAAGRPYRVAVESLGAGTADRVVVLVHGILSDRRTWRYMKGRLAAVHDVLLVDLPGCGESDRPAPGDIGPRAYDPATLAASVLEALRRELRTRSAPAAITLVGHSYGSALILRALGDPGLRRDYADVLDRVDSAVLFSAPDCSYAKRDPTFEGVAEVGALSIKIGNALGLVRAAIADATLQGVEDPSTTPREEIDRIEEVLSDPGKRAAAQSMLRRVVPFTEDLRPDWPRVERLEAENRRIPVPCLLVCGGRDDAVPAALSFKLAAQLPDARLRVVPRAGHGVPVERPEECASLVLAFAEERGAGWVAYGEFASARAGAETASCGR